MEGICSHCFHIYRPVEEAVFEVLDEGLVVFFLRTTGTKETGVDEEAEFPQLNKPILGETVQCNE